MADRLFDNLFIGAGAMKAGTTWLYSVLDRHPEIFFSPEKEIHYFHARHVDPAVLSEERRLANTKQKYLHIDPGKSRAAAVRARLRWAANYLDGPVDDHWYQSLFAARTGQTYVADFSNLYALLPQEAWPQVAARAGRLRVLYTMRAPIDRLWSHVKFHLTITGERDKLDQWGPSEMERFLRQPFLWNNAEYGQAVRRMQGGLPAEALMLAYHETMHADPRAGLRGIERFLGIAPHSYPDALLSQRVNATAATPPPPYFRDLVAKDVERIIGELRDIGLTPPESWEPGAMAAVG
ncbi:MAG: sulfotransferase [Alphaproteobacteria bacterium]|nr:sulfotransferase [Alphaproteobacteria bacterium]NNF72396.1 sulfotransferase [Paracoccaceae bacterium]